MVTEELRKKELLVVNVFLYEIGWTKEVEGCPAFRGIIYKDRITEGTERVLKRTG